MYKNIREDKTKTERGDKVVKSIQDRDKTESRADS